MSGHLGPRQAQCYQGTHYKIGYISRSGDHVIQSPMPWLRTSGSSTCGRWRAVVWLLVSGLWFEAYSREQA